MRSALMIAGIALGLSGAAQRALPSDVSVYVFQDGSPAEVARYLNRHPDPNADLVDGQTPLHWASAYNSREVVALLLNRGADPNALTDGGRAPLHFAAYNNKPGAVALLLDHGARRNVRLNDGRTPLDLAIQMGHDKVIALLRKERANSTASRPKQPAASADPEIAAARESVRQIQSVLEQCGFDPGPIDGIWGRRTGKAAAAFVKAHGISLQAGEAEIMAQIDSVRIGDAGPCPKTASTGSLRDDELRQSSLDDGQADAGPADADPPETANENTDTEATDLESADLRGAELAGANLKNAELDNADLTGANLQGANLSKARLKNAVLKGANLKDAVLDNAQLIGADLRDAVMDGASLAGAALAGARFNVATGLTVAQLGAANWAGQAKKWLNDKALTEFEAGADRLFSIAVEKDGSFRIPLAD